jgi:hypothetical protein
MNELFYCANPTTYIATPITTRNNRIGGHVGHCGGERRAQLQEMAHGSMARVGGQWGTANATPRDKIGQKAAGCW